MVSPVVLLWGCSLQSVVASGSICKTFGSVAREATFTVWLHLSLQLGLVCLLTLWPLLRPHASLHKKQQLCWLFWSPVGGVASCSSSLSHTNIEHRWFWDHWVHLKSCKLLDNSQEIYHRAVRLGLQRDNCFLLKIYIVQHVAFLRANCK